ncbi:hypothetical protein JTB14_021443 [Gonioctena quinquepunctata]|nr:hypothetical protein JTB14_021443 [Gonioctena quinquepunctata]
MKSVNPVTQEKILARQTLDKDFPIFDGNPEDWSLFHQQFQRISTMCQYSEDEIMVKLRKSLRGEAKSSVSAMMMTSKNLELIMKTLQMRFGRPELIIDIILSKISAIPHMKELNIDKLISLSNEVNNLVATMKSLDNYGHYYNPKFLKEFVNKLPDSLKLKWGETVLLNHGRVNMEKFSVWISDIADAATYVTTPCKKYQGRKADIVLNAIRSEKYPKAATPKGDPAVLESVESKLTTYATAAISLEIGPIKHHHRCTGAAQRGQRCAHEMVIKQSGWRPPWQRWSSASSIRAL